MRYPVYVSYLVAVACVIGACGCAKQPAYPTLAAAKDVTRWTEALQDPDSKVRMDALNHLGNVGYGVPELAFAPVAGALKDQDPAVRQEAIRNMWKFEKKASDAVAALTETKDNDTDPKIRADAQTMIKAIQDRQAGRRK